MTDSPAANPQGGPQVAEVMAANGVVFMLTVVYYQARLEHLASG
jgi:hypothetical protein